MRQNQTNTQGFVYQLTKRLFEKTFFAATAILFLQSTSIRAQDWYSKAVYPDTSGHLVYTVDTEGNSIPDFSYAGYRNGDTAIPNVPVVRQVSPVSGDNTTNIQSAIDAAGALSKNSDGIRGAVLLAPGTYSVSGTIKVNQDGVVLRGSGDGSDPSTSTIIKATGNTPSQRPVIVVGGGNRIKKWAGEVSGTRTDITSSIVSVGDRSFNVASAANLRVGDNIIIFHPCTDAWLKSINYGDTDVDPGWTVDSLPLVYNRRILALSGNTITIDAPVFNRLNRSLAQSYIYKFNRSGMKTNLGVENLRVDIQTAGGTDEAHAWVALHFLQAEDAWVRGCTFLHFGLAGVRTQTSVRVTVEDCRCIDPVSLIESERRYNFLADTESDSVLVKNCHASNGRHHYVSNGTSLVSGIAFVNCTSQGAYLDTGGHRQWTQGLLYDNHKELDSGGTNPRRFGLYLRGASGSGHGWASVNSVAWNCNVTSKNNMIIQKPPTAQNWAIGCFGATVDGSASGYPAPDGYVEGANKPGLKPISLYAAQLADRHNTTVPTTSTRQYLIDLGATNLTSAAASQGVKGWNNLTSGDAGAVINSLMDVNGNKSAINLSVTDSFWRNTTTSWNTKGTTNSTVYPASATRDSFYVGTQSGITDNTAQLKIDGLSSNATYTIRLYASRMTTDLISDRTTLYTIQGVTKELQVRNNVDSCVLFDKLKANSGAIDISVGLKQGAIFGYLGVIEIIETEVINPISQSSITRFALAP